MSGYLVPLPSRAVVRLYFLGGQSQAPKEGGPGDLLPRKILKYRVSEIAFWAVRNHWSKSLIGYVTSKLYASYEKVYYYNLSALYDTDVWSAWRAKTTRLGTLFAVTLPNNCILFSCCIVSKDFFGESWSSRARSTGACKPGSCPVVLMLEFACMPDVVSSRFSFFFADGSLPW